MSILGGELAGIFGAAFGAIYESGSLWRRVASYGDDGDVSVSWQGPFPIMVQRDEVTEAMVQGSGYTDRDVRLIVLQRDADGGTVDEPDTGDEIEAYGRRWKLSGITADAARSHWSMRGTLVNA